MLTEELIERAVAKHEGASMPSPVAKVVKLGEQVPLVRQTLEFGFTHAASGDELAESVQSCLELRRLESFHIRLRHHLSHEQLVEDDVLPGGVES